MQSPKVEPKGQEKSGQSNNSVDHVTADELFEMFCTGLKNTKARSRPGSSVGCSVALRVQRSSVRVQRSSVGTMR
jgi:hypothetical protein